MAILTIQPLAVDASNNFTFNNVTATANLVSGNANLGNAASANYFIGNGSLLTGVGNATAIVNGNSNVNIPSANGNVNISAVGNANVLVITGTGANITGTANISGNANVGNLGTAQVLASANVTSPQLISNVATGTSPLVVTSTTLVSNLYTARSNVTDYSVMTTASTGNYYMMAASALTGNSQHYANSVFVANTSNGALYATTFVGALSGAATTAGTVTTNAQPNITSTGTLTSLNVSGNANVGNLGTAQVLASANITSPQLISNVATGTAPLVVSSNTVVANLNADLLDGYNTATANTANTISVRDASGNLSANFFIGNGSQLTGISSSGGSNISNGNSNVSIATSNGNITMSAVGNANILVVTGTGANITGTANVSGNANVGVLNSAGRVTAVDNIIVNSSGGEGGQFILGYAGVSGITGQANSTWNMDVDSSNNFRLFSQNATGVVSGVSMTAYSANTNVLFAGNATAQYFIGNGSQLTGIVASAGAAITNGNSNVTVVANGNVTTSVAGNANILVVTGTGANITGTANVSGILTAANGIFGGAITGQNFAVVAKSTSATDGAFAVQASLANNYSIVSFIDNSNALAGSVGYANPSTTYYPNQMYMWGTNGIAFSGNGYSATGGTKNMYITSAGIVTIPTGVAATNTTTGALVVTGGAGISGNLYVGNVSATSGNFTTANVTGQLISTVATGTAPLAITSTTIVPNLYVARSNVTDYAAMTTASTGNYYLMAASALTGNSQHYANNAFIANTSNGALYATTFVGSLSGALANGNSNVSIPAANGNVNISAVGNANILVVTGTGANITGTANVSGNANVGNLGTAQVLATANVTSPQLISNVATGTSPLVVTSTTVVANLNANALQGSAPASANTASTIALRDANGNISANFFIGNGSQLTGISGGGGGSNISNGNSNVSIATSNGNITMSAVGNANIVVVTGTGANINGYANISGNITSGTGTGGNFTGANVISANTGTFSANVSAGNITTTGQLVSSVATGTAPLAITSTTIVPNLYVARANVSDYSAMTTVSTGNYYLMAASAITGNVQASGNAVFIANTSNGSLYATTFVGNLSGIVANGNSNVSIPAANGNVTISAVGNANVLVVTGTGANITGTANVSGNLSVSGATVPRVVSIADATSVTINGDTTDIATQTNTQATGTLTINAPTGTAFNGQKFIFRLQSTNVQTFSWNIIFAGSTDLTLPTASSGSNKYDYVGFIYNTTAAKWQLLAKNFGF